MELAQALNISVVKPASAILAATLKRGFVIINLLLKSFLKSAKLRCLLFSRLGGGAENRKLGFEGEHFSIKPFDGLPVARRIVADQEADHKRNRDHAGARSDEGKGGSDHDHSPRRKLSISSAKTRRPTK